MSFEWALNFHFALSPANDIEVLGGSLNRNVRIETSGRKWISVRATASSELSASPS